MVAEMAFISEIMDYLDPSMANLIFARCFPSTLHSEFLVIQIGGAKLLQALLRHVCPGEETIEALIAFLHRCPTGDAASAVAVLLKHARENVGPQAQLIVSNLCQIIVIEIELLLSQETAEILKDEAEEAIVMNLSVISGLVKVTGTWLLFDEIFRLMAKFYELDPRGNEHLYRAMGELFVAILVSGTPRFADVVHVLVNGLQAHEGVPLVCSEFLEPIQAFIGSNREGFLSLGISANLIEWCRRLLTLSESQDSLFTIGGLIANIAFVDSTMAPMCQEIADAMITSEKVDMGFIGLEIAAALLVQNGRPAERITAERIFKAIQANWVLTPRHAQLFRLALMTVMHEDSAVTETILPVLAKLRELQEGFADVNREDIDLLEIPNALLSLGLPESFISVYFDPFFETRLFES
jgi:hypothetical protein